MRHILLTLIVILQGCSYATIATHEDQPEQCTSHYTAPVIDTGLALWTSAGVAAVPLALSRASLSNNRETGSVFIFAGSLIAAVVVSSMSAHHGYTEVAKCRDQASNPRPPEQ